MDDCLSEAELGALARGELSPEAAARVQQHAAGCPTCYAQLLRGDKHDTGEQETGTVQCSPRFIKPPPPEVTWAPGTELGRYVILHTLGKGGMGVVFRAYDKDLDRAVALKVLHGDEEEGSSGGPTRLLREAQAMARLAHPNVVAVHDVVVLEKRVCVVMELVEGVTVREWLKREPRPGWREVVEVFRAAGEGLSAAHDAQLVHRDFKPDNVLVGKNGRTQVTDFGIARLAGDASSAPLPRTASPTATSTPTGGSLGSPITREGQVVGTPRYMAPEQFDSAPATFATDQFSFAIALYEALYGQHPFAGGSAAERLQSVRKGEVQPPPASSTVPPWLHRLLVRALAAEPSKRFGSMRELNAALGRDPSAQRNRLLVGGGVAAALVLAVVAAVSSVQARAKLCTGSELKLAGIWDPDRREKVRAAFAATGVPFAEDSFSRAAEVLDDYTSRWAATHKEACEATSVRGEQSAQVLTLRMSCLQHRLDALSATTELFTRADAKLVGKAKQALDALPRLASCSDVARLSSRLPLPEDPQVAAEVERIRTDLTRATVLNEAGAKKEAEKLARPALEAARATGYSPVIAEAELMLGIALSLEERATAARLFSAAFQRGLEDGNDEVVTLSSLRIAGLAYRERQNERGLEWAAIAEASNQRTKDPEAGVMVLNARGNIARNEGDFVKAAEYYEKGAEEAARLLGPDHMTTLGLNYNCASVLQNQGRYREASARFAKVLPVARRVLGPRHPFLSFPLASSGSAAFSRGELADARAAFEETLVITGGKGVNADNAYEGLGEVALAEGRYEEALRHLEKARQVHVELYGEGSVEELGGLAKQGWVLLARGDHSAAWTAFEGVLTRSLRVADAFDSISDSRRGMARILLDRGEPKKALPLAEEAVAALLPTRGRRHPMTLDGRLVAAEVRWALGRQEEARRDAREILADGQLELSEGHRVLAGARSLLARGEGTAKAIP